MAEKYVPATFQSQNFHCPHCGVHAHHYWNTVYHGPPGGSVQQNQDLKISYCNHCQNYLLWRDGTMIYPKPTIAPMPSDDMPHDVKADYLEARNIVADSSRAAAALLRLALQKLMPHLEERGENLNVDIASLVKKGLPVKVQQALDAVRVIGNNAVHPGEIDLRDEAATASALFDLLNMIVEVLVTQPKKVAELYDRVPESAKEAIERRDKR